MKLSQLAWIGALSFCLLSGCAYMQGRKDDQNAAAQAAKQETKQGKAVDVSTESVKPPVENPPNPAEDSAAKMMAPITHF